MSGNDMTYNDYLTNPVHSRFSLSPVSEKKALNIISKLKNKKSYGIDGISNVLLNSIANEIIKPLTLIINQSLETGIFPDAFKGGRHLHEIFNESIIFMSHFSIGMIDIHKKISLRIFFFNSKWPLSLGSKNRKNFPP